MKQDQDKYCRLVILVDENLRKAFKHYCVKNNLKMSVFLKDYIEKVVAHDQGWGNPENLKHLIDRM